MRRARRTSNAVLVGLVLGLLGAAFFGADKGERAHRALNMQYHKCELKFGFGGPGFRECLAR